MADDSTDWTSTRAPFIEKFEEKLRCPVCREVLRRAPTITECGHTFCGECIGRHLNTEKTCPLCRTEIQRAKLRLNKIIEDLADDWALVARQQLLEQLRAPPTTVKSASPQIVDADDLEETSSQAETISIPPSDEQTPAALPEGYGTCPICARAMPISEIEGKHIEGCLKTNSSLRPSNSINPPPRKKRATFGVEHKSLDRITIPFYPGLAELKLRNLLKEAGLSTKGSKQKLIARHQEWANIWNTNIVSKHPRSAGELRQMMAQWDRAQEQSGPKNLKELDAAEWAQQNQASFDELVKNARKARDEKRNGVSGALT